MTTPNQYIQINGYQGISTRPRLTAGQRDSSFGGMSDQINIAREEQPPPQSKGTIQAALFDYYHNNLENYTHI